MPLVKAAQEQQLIIDRQQKQIDILEKRLTHRNQNDNSVAKQ